MKNNIFARRTVRRTKYLICFYWNERNKEMSSHSANIHVKGLWRPENSASLASLFRDVLGSRLRREIKPRYFNFKWRPGVVVLCSSRRSTAPLLPPLGSRRSIYTSSPLILVNRRDPDYPSCRGRASCTKNRPIKLYIYLRSGGWVKADLLLATNTWSKRTNNNSRTEEETPNVNSARN